MPIPPPDYAPKPALEVLTDRHRECLALAARGLNSCAIGKALGLSPRTVDEHFARACEVLGVRTRIQAVALTSVTDISAPCRAPPGSRSSTPRTGRDGKS
ncbi:helix-turn-helix transcriptional regulator [Brevundimonas sp.]|uniref:helix-turn-helix domain-containing protein n=1 Tax=Brevundimonas sp. TaxID=1871086 RepID=UPI001D5E41CE|nr:helix-turn-helix transcriptional regulator [Brevundimonas sp.]MBA4001094.1 hypothetical protein [Brevundimonas sp.]